MQIPLCPPFAVYMKVPPEGLNDQDVYSTESQMMSHDHIQTARIMTTTYEDAQLRGSPYPEQTLGWQGCIQCLDGALQM